MVVLSIRVPYQFPKRYGTLIRRTLSRDPDLQNYRFLGTIV